MKVVSIGEVNVDWLSLVPGATLLDATTFCRALGGNATNVAVGLKRLDELVCLVGKVGKDFHGDFLKQALKGEGLSLDWIITDPESPTAQCYMTTSQEGQHQFRNWPHPHAADKLLKEELPQDLLAEADCLHATAISMIVNPRREAIETAIAAVHSRGGIISFDAGFPPSARKLAHKEVESILPKVHLLKMNESELFFWADSNTDNSPEDIGRLLFQRYQPVALLLTCAAKGSVIFTDNDIIQCPALRINAVSEVGAGDAYIAGMIHSLSKALKTKPGTPKQALAKLTGDEWRQSGIIANVCGALNTLAESANAGMPDQVQLEAALTKMALQAGQG